MLHGFFEFIMKEVMCYFLINGNEINQLVELGIGGCYQGIKAIVNKWFG